MNSKSDRKMYSTFLRNSFCRQGRNEVKVCGCSSRLQVCQHNYSTLPLPLSKVTDCARVAVGLQVFFCQSWLLIQCFTAFLYTRCGQVANAAFCYRVTEGSTINMLRQIQ